MIDFLDICLRRQSCRQFADRPVEHDKLVKCVEAGRLTPSACNSQPWSFVVAETPEVVAQVATCGQQLKLNSFLSKAKAFIVVVEEYAVLNQAIRCFLDSQYFAKNDLGAATLQICLEAETQGLGSCIIGMYDRAKLCEILDLPRETRFGSLIALGYPLEDKVRAKDRKPLDKIVKFV